MRVWTAFVAALALASCAPQPAPNPAIWRIADSDSEIWLFGTVHILPPDLRWRSEAVDDAFAAADELVVETDTDDPSLGQLTTERGVLPPGRTLSSLLAPEDQTRMVSAVRALRLDLAQFEQLQPWFAAVQLSYAYAISNGHSADAGVERVLIADARERGMALSYLETAEQQINALADLSRTDQLAFLEATLAQVEQGGDSMAVLDTAWVTGDVATLARALEEEWRSTSPAIRAAVISQRNAAWTEQIAARLEGSGRIFIAVGAAHLVGDDSVVALLRARGIEVEGP